MSRMQRSAACLLGGLVADAATLGLHWVYDVTRIADIAERHDSGPAFVAIEQSNYAGVTSYYIHGHKSAGMASQYGETLRAAVQSMLDHDGAFDVSAYQKKFVNVFGPGGTWQGYIDRPTRGTLNNIQNDVLEPSGVDDDQHPAISILPAITSTYHLHDGFAEIVRTAVQVTNNNGVAVEYGQIFADLLSRVLDGEDLPDALQLVAQSASGDAGDLLRGALSTRETDSVEFGEHTRRACHLPMGMPLSFHILAHARSFKEAVEKNILAGGDNCGRAIIIGSIMGAAQGVLEVDGIPLDWVLKTADNANIWQECQKLAALTHSG